MSRVRIELFGKALKSDKESAGSDPANRKRRKIKLWKRGVKLKERSVVLIFHLMILVTFAALLLTTLFSSLSCSGLEIIEGNRSEGAEVAKGRLLLSFSKEYKVEDVKKLSEVEDLKKLSGMGDEVVGLRAYEREMPDSNSFILEIRRESSKGDGELIYKGRYDKRPGELELETGNYSVEVYSSEPSAPKFDAPRYSDSKMVLIEADRSVALSFLCRQVNGAVRLNFSREFKERFSGYSVEIEESRGEALYPFNESRFLYTEVGELFIWLKKGVNNSFLITRRAIWPAEMVTLNLHSTSGAGEEPWQPGEGEGINLIKGVEIDTLSVWISEELVVGERRDGSSRELALSVEELPIYIGEKGVWVWGYLSGYLTTATLFHTPPFNTDSNVAISSKQGEEKREFCAGVALPQGEIRENLNLKSNPSLLGRKVFFKGNVDSNYFGLVGMKNVTHYHLE